MKRSGLRTFLAFLLFSQVGLADGPPARKPIQVVSDRAAFLKKVRALGHAKMGGIDKSKTESDDGRDRSFPHFTSSFKFQGTTYPYTMVGFAPSSGKSAAIRPVLIPLRMRFAFFADHDIVFEPGNAVNNMLKSPLFNDAAFANGVGQFGEMLQRATFWNKMDTKRSWHVTFSKPRVTQTVDVLVEPDIGDVFQVGGPNDLLADVRFGALDSTIHTILQFSDVQPDELPIFVTDNVFADVALGYHDAFVVGQNDGTDVLQTLVYSSWLEPALVGDLLADVSTLNHEVGEWLNDPYVNNIVPLWNFPNISLCADNPFLEVGDPQGNGPNFADFPTVPILLNGYTYHLQDLVMLPWFTGEKPSSAQNGWYDFPATTEIHAPFVPCGP